MAQDVGNGDSSTISTAPRSITPQRFCRPTTPIRPNSAGRNDRESDRSRRKQKRFNNENFGSEEARHDADWLEPFMKIPVEWRSSLGDLVNGANEDVREMIRKGCEPKEQTSLKDYRVAHRTADEQRFLQIPRRSRVVTVRALQNADFLAFIRDAESTLLHYMNTGAAFEHPSGSATIQDSKLVMDLHDSAFHRLLFHSVCQFYSLPAKSEDRDHGKRVVVVSPACQKANPSPNPKWQNEEDAPRLSTFVLHNRTQTRDTKLCTDAGAAA